VAGLERQGVSSVAVNNTPYLVVTLVAQASRLQYVLDDSDPSLLSQLLVADLSTAQSLLRLHTDLHAAFADYAQRAAASANPYAPLTQRLRPLRAAQRARRAALPPRRRAAQLSARPDLRCSGRPWPGAARRPVVSAHQRRAPAAQRPVPPRGSRH
jgi:hypothetical protein